MRWTLTSLLVLWWFAGADAAPVERLALSVRGLPDGQTRQVTGRVATLLLADRNQPLVIVDPHGPWLWHDSRSGCRAEIRFDRYYAAGQSRHTFPQTPAAGYAYEALAEGRVVLLDPALDSVLAVVPFTFSWQHPLDPSRPDAGPDSMSAHAATEVTPSVEADVAEALACELTRLVRRALHYATDIQS